MRRSKPGLGAWNGNGGRRLVGDDMRDRLRGLEAQGVVVGDLRERVAAVEISCAMVERRIGDSMALHVKILEIHTSRTWRMQKLQLAVIGLLAALIALVLRGLGFEGFLGLLGLA